jgi:hypothetical protein
VQTLGDKLYEAFIAAAVLRSVRVYEEEARQCESCMPAIGQLEDRVLEDLASLAPVLRSVRRIDL